MKNSEKLEAHVALELLIHGGDVAEEHLMDTLRPHLVDLVPAPSRPGENIPEVSSLLREWNHAGLIGCKVDSFGPTTFYIRDQETLRTLLTDLLGITTSPTRRR